MNKNKTKIINFPTYSEANGRLGVFESSSNVPFEIKRVFTVTAKKGDVRGDHAHKLCNQLLVCISGSIKVECNSRDMHETFLLDDMKTGILIPPGVWATQKYLEDNAVLMVLCDRSYEEDDYLRDFESFNKYINERECK